MFGVDDMIAAGMKLLDRVIPDPAAKQAAQLELLKLTQSGELAQITAQTAINQQEASNPNMFVAGWRPFVGWVCGVAFSVQFVVGPTFTFIAALRGKAVTFPQLDLQTMMPVLLGMLGLAGYRSWEKVNDAAGNH